MTNTKFASGAFVFTRARGLQPRDPDELPPIAARHGVAPDFIPSYAGDRVAISRAASQASSGLHREGFLLRPITRTSSQVVFGIVREQRDEDDHRLDHDFEASVSWSAEPDPSIVAGDHPIAQRVADAFQELRGKVTADDWSSVITSYLEAHDAARVRGDGRVYWVPPQRLDTIRRFGALLADVGIDLVLAEIEAESQTVVEHVAQDSLDEQLDRLQQEAEAFDGTQKPSTYSRRLAEYQHLRDRAVLYRDALGVGVERAEQVLNELEQKVTTMLDIRRQTVIHRDRTADQVQTHAATSVAPNSLLFAGATFTPTKSDDPSILLFVSDDNYARSSAKALEAMGLAGKWQKAGACQVSIQNSGPPGAAVSIRLRLPEKQTLSAAAKALSGLGIEVN
jgi:hypothetical protein